MDIQTLLFDASSRYSGILVHPTSFPSPYGIGDLGSSSYKFIDFLVASKQKVWQVLPLGPTGYGDSPYQSFSSFAGQPLLISPDELIKQNLLEKDDILDLPKFSSKSVDYGTIIPYKFKLLHIAYENFIQNTNKALIDEHNNFIAKHQNWLEEYSLFMALKEQHNGEPWFTWEEKYRFLTIEQKMILQKKLAKQIAFYYFIQFIFFKQWIALRNYANEKGIILIGDIPIFVSPDSADVWAHQSLFQLDEKGLPTKVAGVPPDYFSETGQLWGNPLYNWEAHEKDGYLWWIQRIKHQLHFTNYIRIDHFRGFEAYWSVPYGENTAIHGTWEKAPGDCLFTAIKKTLGEQVPIIAEDLGIITDEVRILRDKFHFPGMRVLQFGFDDVNDNEHLPYHYPIYSICYTGTHDNNTTLGWYETAQKQSKEKVCSYMNSDGKNINWDFIRTIFSSPSFCAIVPIQDILSLGSESRMNKPGCPSNNWMFRFSETDLTEQLTEQLQLLTQLYARS